MSSMERTLRRAYRRRTGGYEAQIVAMRRRHRRNMIDRSVGTAGVDYRDLQKVFRSSVPVRHGMGLGSIGRKV